MRIAVYPGTFDPITKGHLDLIERSLTLVDKLYIAVAADNVAKSILFSARERIEMINDELIANNIDLERVRVEVFSGLLVDFAKRKTATLSIRGLRVISDFEYEFQMANINFNLDKTLETILLPARVELQLVSSKLAKELVKLGGNTNNFLSDNVRKKLEEKYI